MSDIDQTCNVEMKNAWLKQWAVPPLLILTVSNSVLAFQQLLETYFGEQQVFMVIFVS